MIYISHLLPDDEMQEIISQTGVGIESIEFSISDNLDHLNDSIRSYRERMKNMGCQEMILHGPFMNIDPAAFDSEVRKVTKMRFHQTYTAGMELEGHTFAVAVQWHSEMMYDSSEQLKLLKAFVEAAGKETTA